MTTTIPHQLPELSGNQLKLLKRVLLEELIATKTQNEDQMLGTCKSAFAALRAEQRKRLDNLIGEDV